MPLEVEDLPRDGFERVVRFTDSAAKLDAVITLHSTALGPAAGGCRNWSYPTIEDAVLDSKRLARAMSRKNALAGLHFGGGKSVIRKLPGQSRRDVFLAYGEALEVLAGKYIAAEDVGTSVGDMLVAREVSSFVSGIPGGEGKAGGDPGPWTALGVFESMKFLAHRGLGRPLSDTRVAILGVGSVGGELSRLLSREGAELVIADVNGARVEEIALRDGAQIEEPERALLSDVDIVAPCALGGSLDSDVARRMRAKVIVGAANNQLAHRSVGDVLSERGILYAPDFVVNAGGVISICCEYSGQTEDDVRARVMGTPSRLARVLNRADVDGVTPNVAAEEIADEIIETAKLQ